MLLNGLLINKRYCFKVVFFLIDKLFVSSLLSIITSLFRSYIDQRSVDHGKETSDQVHVSTISTSLWALESILKGTSTFSPSRR